MRNIYKCAHSFYPASWLGDWLKVFPKTPLEYGRLLKHVKHVKHVRFSVVAAVEITAGDR